MATSPAAAMRRAFTLIELLIVLAIISVVVALGIPLFGVLTGSRSVEAGRNVVAATIGQARTVAVNEGKYAGVLFYVDPATERTAMAIVVVTDPASSLEDPDPYDKYKSYVDKAFAVPYVNTVQTPVGNEQEYYTSKPDPNDKNVRVRGDRVIEITHDANNTYRGQLYAQTPIVSDYLRYFGNYRPVVRAFSCLKPHTTNSSNDNSNDTDAPPLNGPYGGWAGSPAMTPQYKPNGGTAPFPNTAITKSLSTDGPFANALWGSNVEQPIVRYTSSDQVLLPRGVGVQVMTQPLIRAGSPNFQERYLRTGIIMFDPQGRLTVIKNFLLNQADPANPLGDYLGLTATARNIPSGVGLVLYDSQAFATAVLPATGSTQVPKTSQADWLYQPATGNQYVMTSKFTNIFADYPSAATDDEQAEETWLDANAAPLVINRFTGSLSEAE